MATPNSKEIKERSKEKEDDGEGLYVKGRTDHRDSHQLRGKSRLKSREALLDWIMDLGGSNHMTPRFILELKRNLISLGTLEKEEYRKIEVGQNQGSDRLCSFKLIGSVSGGIIKRFKHKAFGKFKKWKQLVKNQAGWTNGLEERMNRTLMDTGHYLLIQSGLPKTFWAKVTCTFAYLINRSPSTTFEKMTPMEKWSGHPSDYRMLRIFGCVVYSYVKQGELEPRAVKCVFLGYLEGVKGYMLYRRDGFFEEEQDLGVSRSSNWVKAGSLEDISKIDASNQTFHAKEHFIQEKSNNLALCVKCVLHLTFMRRTLLKFKDSQHGIYSSSTALRRRNRRVPYDQRNNPPQNPRIVYPPILNISYFRNILDILQNYKPMDDEPMWAVVHVVAPTPGSTITILETANEFAIKGNHLTLVKGKQFDGRNKTDPHKHIYEFLGIYDMFKYRDTKNEVVCLMMFSLSLTGEAKTCDNEEDEPTPQPKIQNPKPVKETPLPKPCKLKIPYPQRLRKEKMEAQYGKFLDMIRSIQINVPFIDVLTGMPNYEKFLKELISNKHKIKQIFAAFLSDESLAMIQNKVPPKLEDPGSFLIPSENMLVKVGKFTFPVDFVILEMEEDSKVPLILGRPFLHIADAVIQVKQKQLNLGVGTKRMIFNIDSTMKHSYSNDVTYFSIDVIYEILKEYFDALLDKGSKILHSIDGTYLKEEISVEFDGFMAMTTDENFDSESDTEEPPFEKITIDTDYKIKTSLEEPPTDIELKSLLDNLEYVFLKEPSFVPVIISF
nr:reverse transcriptase domain-containing protein [Tanacetum cinerariifolium]